MHIYAKRISEISWADIEAFCDTNVTENSYLDYKREFPTDLAKTVSAMANTFGGVVIIGVDEDDNGGPVLPIAGIPTQRGLEERVVNVMVDNTVPPIIPEVAVCPNADGSRAAIVVRVAQSPAAPHAIRSNTRVYIRTGKSNSPEDLVSLDRLGWLTNRRERSVEFRNELIERAAMRFVDLRDGRVPDTPATEEREQLLNGMQPGLLTIALTPTYPDRPLITARKLETLLHNLRVRDRMNTGDAFPLPLAPRFVQDGVVVHLSGVGGLRTYHTHVNIHGLYFFKQSLLYTLPAQLRETREPRTFLRSKELVARVYAMLESGRKLCDALGYRGSLQLLCRLDSILGLPMLVGMGDTIKYSADQRVESSLTINAEDLNEDVHPIVHQLLQSVGWAFGWDIEAAELRQIYEWLQRQ